MAGRGLEGCSAILPASLPAAQESAAALHSAPSFTTKCSGPIHCTGTKGSHGRGGHCPPVLKALSWGAGVCCPWRRYETAHSKAVTLTGKGSPHATAPAGSGRFCCQSGSPTQRRLIKRTCPPPPPPLLFITLPHFSSLEPVLASCLAVLGSLCTACPMSRTGPPWGWGPVGLVYHDVPGTRHPGSARHREGTRQVLAEQEQMHCGDTGSGRVS